MRERWTFRYAGGELTLIEAHQASVAEQRRALPEAEAAARLEQLSRGGASFATIGRRALVEMAGSFTPLAVERFRLDDRWLLDRLLAAVRRQSLLVLETRFSHVPRGDRPQRLDPIEPPPPPPDEKTTWIELELVDTNGEPVPHVRYRLTPSSGPARGGTLDGVGFARIDGLDPVDYKVTFLDIDGREWKKA